MSGLSRFERRLEGLVSGVFARAFKGAVEPVETECQGRSASGDGDCSPVHGLSAPRLPRLPGVRRADRRDEGSSSGAG